MIIPYIIKITILYIITPAIFDILENQEPGKGGEIQLTDALKTLSTQEAIYAYNFEGRRYGLYDKLVFLKSSKLYSKKNRV